MVVNDHFKRVFDCQLGDNFLACRVKQEGVIFVIEITQQCHLVSAQGVVDGNGLEGRSLDLLACYQARQLHSLQG